MEEFKTAAIALAKKASESHDSAEAMRYAQAAQNLAQAAASLREQKPVK